MKNGQFFNIEHESGKNILKVSRLMLVVLRGNYGLAIEYEGCKGIFLKVKWNNGGYFGLK